jgi:flagellar biosynthetic protein FliR
MQNEIAVPIGSLLGFLAVFTRVAGIFLLVPLPGVRVGPDLPRVALSICLTLSLSARWPAISQSDWSAGAFLRIVLSELGLGLAIGLATAVLAEAVALAAQMASLQAGLSYASMIDPITQNESTTLLVLAQLVGGLLFFALGLEREVVRAVAASLDFWPPGAFRIGPQVVEQITTLTGAIFAAGTRLALPVVGILVLVDIAFGLLSRMRSQMQVVSLLLAAKLLVALVALSISASVLSSVYRELSGRVVEQIGRIASGSF